MGKDDIEAVYAETLQAVLDRAPDARRRRRRMANATQRPET
jgi:hypothetical protein